MRLLIRLKASVKRLKKLKESKMRLSRQLNTSDRRQKKHLFSIMRQLPRPRMNAATE